MTTPVGGGVLDECPMCLSLAVPPVVLRPCGHVMCGPCLDELERVAPMPRRFGDENNNYTNNDGYSDDDDYYDLSDEIDDFVGRDDASSKCVICRALIAEHVVPIDARSRALEAANDEQRAADATFMARYRARQTANAEMRETARAMLRRAREEDDRASLARRHVEYQRRAAEQALADAHRVQRDAETSAASAKTYRAGYVRERGGEALCHVCADEATSSVD